MQMPQGGSTSALTSQSMQPPDKRKVVTFTENGKPIGPYVAMYCSQLGKMTRTHCSPTYETWSDVDPSCKKDLWNGIVAEFVVPEEHKEKQFKHANKLWKNWKSKIRIHMDKFDTIQEKKQNIKKGVRVEDWEFLVDYESTNDAKIHRQKGKVSQSKVKYLHTSGRRGSARTAELLLAKDPTNLGTRTDVFMALHTRADGTFLSEEIGEKINKIIRIVGLDPGSKHMDLDHDPVAQVTGVLDGRGRVRGYGDNVFKTGLMAATPYKKKAQEIQSTHVELLSEVGSLKSQLHEETRACMELQKQVNDYSQCEEVVKVHKCDTLMHQMRYLHIGCPDHLGKCVSC